MDISPPMLSRQSGLIKELNVVANNIANAGTNGFKREAGIFAEYIHNAGEASVSLGALRGHYADLKDGALIPTGGTLNVAISGPGMFAVDTPQGVFLTRDGTFSRNADGQLVSTEGYTVLDEGGGAIEIPFNVTDIAIGPDGTVSLDGVATGRLGVFEASADSLQRVGNNLWRATTGYRFVDEPQINQGFVEQSNVNPVQEMARLIEAQRLFEAGQNILDDDHQRQEKIIRYLGSNQ